MKEINFACPSRKELEGETTLKTFYYTSRTDVNWPTCEVIGELDFLYSVVFLLCINWIAFVLCREKYFFHFSVFAAESVNNNFHCGYSHGKAILLPIVFFCLRIVFIPGLLLYLSAALLLHNQLTACENICLFVFWFFISGPAWWSSLISDCLYWFSEKTRALCIRPRIG